MTTILGRLGLAALAILSCLSSWQAIAEPAMRVEATGRQPDGKILFAGQSRAAPPGTIVIGRLNGDGTMDASFGSGGVTQYSSPVASEFRATALTVLAGGSIVAATVRDGLVALVQFDTFGTVDAAYGAGGISVDSQSAGLVVNALVPSPNGGVLAIGGYQGTYTANVMSAAMARYSSSGVRDEAFGAGPAGVRTFNMGSQGSELRAAAQWANGDIAAAGYSSASGEKSHLLARFHPDGSQDTAFGGSGWMAVEYLYGADDEAFAVAAHSSGDIVAVGRESQPPSRITLMRFSQFGNFVQAFDRSLYIPDDPYTFSGSTGVSVAETPEGDLLIGAPVIRAASGQAYFGFIRTGTDFPAFVGPLTSSSDVPVAVIRVLPRCRPRA